MNIIKGKGQRLIPEELLKYLEALKNKYPDAVDLVEANPTLEGGEDSLSSVLINGTKYAVGGGGKLYQHVCHVTNEAGLEVFCLELITRDNTPLTLANLVTILTNRYTADQKEDFHVIPTKDTIYVAKAFIYGSAIRIRKSNLSDISTMVNFDVTVLENDIISEI